MSEIGWRSAVQAAVTGDDVTNLQSCLVQGQLQSNSILYQDLHKSSQLLSASAPPALRSKPKDRKERRRQMADLLALDDINSALENATDEELALYLGGLLHVFNTSNPSVVACGLASKAGASMFQKLAGVHSRFNKVTSEYSQLVLSVLWAAAYACDQVHIDEDYGEDASMALNHMAGDEKVLEILLTHFIYLAVDPANLLTQAGLVTATRALRTIFSLQMKNLEHSRRVTQLCQAAGLGDRALQIAATPVLLTADEYGVATGDADSKKAALLSFKAYEPLDAPKGLTHGELFTQLLSTAITYAGFSSGIFDAVQGRMVLDATSMSRGAEWLMRGDRLQLIKVALDTCTRVLYYNDLLSHVECPEMRHVDVAVRNLMLMLTLPVCGSKRHEDIIQLTTNSIELYRAYHVYNYLPVFERILTASGSSSAESPLPPAAGDGDDEKAAQVPESAAAGTSSTSASSEPKQSVKPAQYYKDGELQGYFGKVAAVMYDAVPMLAEQMSGWQVDMQEGKAAMSTFIQDNLARFIVWSDILMKAIQESQQIISGGRQDLTYRPATWQSTETASDAPASATSQAASTTRRCAMCASKPGKLLTCSKCGVAVYCSRDCQLAHWSAVHKVQCKSIQQKRAAALAEQVA